MSTEYHSKYFAHELSRRHSASDSEKIAGALFDAQVDLNPHQVASALFAFKSPLSKGAILADEVGLGKTIEAGLVLSQKWAEQKRRILIIGPANLRKQWMQELQDKFFLPSIILEAKNYNRMQKEGIKRPFEQKEIVICSFQFAAGHSDELMMVPWDLVVIDEAHRLRNVYKNSNKIGRSLRSALMNAPKVLLTATPLQNTLLELYGLVSFVDEYAFGDLKSFRRQYARLTSDDNFQELKERLKPLCHRTLRRQVLEYIKYTNRIPITQEYEPFESEQALYDLVSDYLQRPNLKALPSSQRSLMTLLMRRLLASSSFAIAGALSSLANKLQRQLEEDAALKGNLEADEDDLVADYDGFAEEAEEWVDDELDPDLLHEDEIEVIRQEITDLKGFRDLAVSITDNAKAQALLKALEVGFAKASEMGAAEKAIVFTESRRTQEYLHRHLTANGYDGALLLFNGANNDPQSRAIYEKWKSDNAGTDRVTGLYSADMRAALVDHFRHNAKIMIATEAAAEGINLQFASMVVNYDLPWNPQRIEQRIGRCHRYGQKYDVVVINFLNKTNAADQRVFQLLSEKFKLFDGVFGASDEVLGAVGSGVEFEKRIVEIYQTCRDPKAIDDAFNALRDEMEESISATMEDTRKQLLENFDAEVHEKLRVNMNESTAYLNRYESMLWAMTKFELQDKAEFGEEHHSFTLSKRPIGCPGTVPLGRYQLYKEPRDAHRYRLGHPLALFVIKQAANRSLPVTKLTLDYSGWPQEAEVIKSLVGKSGELAVGKLSITGSDAQDHIVFAGYTDCGLSIIPDQIRRMLAVPVASKEECSDLDAKRLLTMLKAEEAGILADIESRRASWFDDEIEKLDHWASDKRNALKQDLKDLDDELKELKKQGRSAGNLQEKLALQRKVKALESKRDEAWRAYDEQAKVIEGQKDSLLDEIEERLTQETSSEILFMIRWELV